MLFLYLLMCAINWVHIEPMVIFICLHITLPHFHLYADLPESIEFLKCLSGTFSSVCLRLSKFAQLFFTQYMGLCVFSSPISLMMIVRICVSYLITIIKLEVWPICHCLGLDNETMVCIVCVLVFFIFLFLSHNLTALKQQKHKSVHLTYK